MPTLVSLAPLGHWAVELGQFANSFALPRQCGCPRGVAGECNPFPRVCYFHYSLLPILEYVRLPLNVREPLHSQRWPVQGMRNNKTMQLHTFRRWPT